MTNEEIMMLCIQAGVLPSEIKFDPIHGPMLNMSGLRKLTALSDNPPKARAFVDDIEQTLNEHFKRTLN
jgi:hypothetical protein